MRVNINLSEDLLKQIDEKAKSLFISRSAYISTALSQKLQSDKLMDNIPEIMQTMKEAVRLENQKSLPDQVVDQEHLEEGEGEG